MSRPRVGSRPARPDDPRSRPPHGGPSAGPAGGGGLRPWATAASIPIVLAVLPMALVVENLLRDLHTLSFVRDALPVSESEVHLTRARLAFFGRATAILWGGGLLLWVAWQYRAHALLRASGVEGLRFGPVWGTAAWLLPIPLMPLALRELWRASDPFAEGTAWRRRRTHVLVWAWSLALAATAACLVRGFALAARPNAGALELIARDRWLIAAMAAGMVAAVAGAVLVHLITGRVELCAYRAGVGPWRPWTDVPGRAEEARRAEGPG